MMEQAAAACRDVENLACAADAARLLIRAEPHSPRLCLWRAHTMRAATLSDGHAMLVGAKKMFVHSARAQHVASLSTGMN